MAVADQSGSDRAGFPQESIPLFAFDKIQPVQRVGLLQHRHLMGPERIGDDDIGLHAETSPSCQLAGGASGGLDLGIGFEAGGQKRPRVGLRGRVEDLFHRPLLDDLAGLHHDDAIGEIANHRQVVGDEEVGQAEFATQVLEQVDHLRLDRDVERRDRLVADDQLRARAPAPGRWRCAGAGRRRTGAGSARHARARGRPARAARRRGRCHFAFGRHLRVDGPGLGDDLARRSCAG